MVFFKGFVCFVVGGVNGLGCVIVQRLVQYGCRVVIVDFFLSEGDKVVSDLGENCIFVLIDVREKLFMYVLVS